MRRVDQQEQTLHPSSEWPDRKLAGDDRAKRWLNGLGDRLSYNHSLAARMVDRGKDGIYNRAGLGAALHGDAPVQRTTM